jgi:hypothetical protein
MKKENAIYRIKQANGNYLNAGTDLGSWFTLRQARRLVNYKKGETIVEHDGLRELWEIF